MNRGKDDAIKSPTGKLLFFIDASFTMNETLLIFVSTDTKDRRSRS